MSPQRSSTLGPLIGIVLLFVASGLLGGGARGDISSLMILRPISVLLLGYGLWNLEWRHVSAYRHVFALAVAVVGLVGLHLISLPPGLWSQLPGRHLVVEIDQTAGLGEVWRPVTLTPEATWNAFYALSVPLAFLILGSRLSFSHQSKLLYVALSLGLLNAVLVTIQIVSPTNDLFYFYHITNTGSAVGLFANRNHASLAIAIMIPMLAVFASLRGWVAEPPYLRISVAIITGVFVTMLVLISGSRSGLICAVLGAAAIPWLYLPGEFTDLTEVRSQKGALKPRARHDVLFRKKYQPWTIAGLIALLLLSVSIFAFVADRAESIQRILRFASADESRFKVWPSIVEMTWTYFPVGSGVGSFAEVYKVNEQREWLDSFYMNHAHNDYLEVVLTGGLPAALILVWGAMLVIARTYSLVKYRNDVGEAGMFARLGMVLVILLAGASAGDYPLRTPALAAFFMLAVLWASAPVPRPVRV